MKTETRRDIDALIRSEIVPATGCTEPIAVSFTTAAAAELLEDVPTQIDVYLSTNVLKNAMGVGIPGTGMIGLPIAIALGAIIRDSSKGLNILENITPELVAKGKAFLNEVPIKIGLKDEPVDKLYIEINIATPSGGATAIVEHLHTNIVKLVKNGEVLLSKSADSVASDSEDESDGHIMLNYDLVYRYATEAPLEEIRYIIGAAEMNKKASEESSAGDFGHGIGKMLTSPQAHHLMGDTVYTRVLSVTANACDGRMGGMPIPVMSNSGSGNQGIASSLPVYSYAKEIGATEEQMARAIMLSSLMVIYIKQSLGRLSALCGCVVAATGSACGITYLMGGTKEQIGYAIKNMIANITGMMCDGAKPGCALKVATGVSSAMLAAMMAIEERVVTPTEGIIDNDVDKTIRNLTLIGADAMQQVDKVVLDIMTTK
ncbi:MAG: L-serine ammonia-lyase, iron-sulfur-dependent, subunit alpha [Porphyromonas sp.]|nr:L-serine ammonia-lyase, iron-sulfur-dependent, subunit alpha [Porphyromonas sp.]